jgi:AbiTii
MLLDEIITLLSDENSSLTAALLKTKVLLHQIGKRELADWVNNELNGYPDEATIPGYRKLSSRVLANLMNPGWQISSHPIPIGHLAPEERERLETATMTQSLAVLEELAAKAKGQGHLTRPIPMEANFRLGKNLGSGFRIQQAWCETGIHEKKRYSFTFAPDYWISCWSLKTALAKILRMPSSRKKPMQ